MKAIMIMFDSLNRHMLPPYGDTATHAPNFQRLAERAVTFDNCYVGSMPCMPARRELHTGRINFLHRSWGPLEPFDDSMPALLSGNGIHTHLSTDHYHYFEDGGATYHTRYSTYGFFRGQEGEPWKGQLADPPMPPGAPARKDGFWRQDRINRRHMRGENHPQSKTFADGLEFINTNHADDGWFLQIEAFDPHEPFFSSERFLALYGDDDSGDPFDWPPYRRVTETDEQVAHVIRRYRALVSYCDESLGRVMDQMDAHGLWDDTLLIVCTDHGFLLGEHGWWAKTTMPFYNEIAHTPLFVWDPRLAQRGCHRQSLVQMIDLAPTLLDFFGLPIPPDMRGRPLRGVMETDTPIREAALFGLHGAHVNCTDGRYVYMRAPAALENAPLYNYTLMPCHMRGFFTGQELSGASLHPPLAFTKGLPVLQTPSRGWNGIDPINHPFEVGTLLFDLQNDPGQLHPVSDPATEDSMARKMVALMRENDCPPEQYERLGLQALL